MKMTDRSAIIEYQEANALSESRVRIALAHAREAEAKADIAESDARLKRYNSTHHPETLIFLSNIDAFNSLIRTCSGCVTNPDTFMEAVIKIMATAKTQ